MNIEPFDYHPLFGLALPSFRIVCGAEEKLPVSFMSGITVSEP